MHIPGPENSISDIPSRSFWKKVKWYCNSDNDFLTMFNEKFPLPSQNSWSLFQIPKRLSSRVISILLTQASTTHEWTRLSKARTSTLTRGVPMRKLWEWTLGCRKRTDSTNTRSEPSQDSGQESKQDTSATDARLALRRYSFRSHWPDDFHGHEIQPTKDEWVRQAADAVAAHDVRV